MLATVLPRDAQRERRGPNKHPEWSNKSTEFSVIAGRELDNSLPKRIHFGYQVSVSLKTDRLALEIARPEGCARQQEAQPGEQPTTLHVHMKQLLYTTKKGDTS